MAPVVLRGLIPRKVYKCFCLLKKIYDIVYSRRFRIEGWNEEQQMYFKGLLWKHAILYENLYGIASCTENLEYSLHMPEDVRRHSMLDNYWCYLYEYQVKYYKQQTPNIKCLCKTFADRACQLRFISTYLSSHRHDHHIPSNQLTLNSISKPPVLLNASSVQYAIELKEQILICLKFLLIYSTPWRMESFLVNKSTTIYQIKNSTCSSSQHNCW